MCPPCRGGGVAAALAVKRRGVCAVDAKVCATHAYIRHIRDIRNIRNITLVYIVYTLCAQYTQ